jgi:homoserine kinase
MALIGRASSPATSGNIGPGFDVIALSLELRCSVTAIRSEEWKADHVGAYPLPAAGHDLILQAAQEAVGEENPLSLTVDNSIPLGRGLGSSSAAFASGWAAARRAVGEEVNLDELYEATSAADGHGDNAAGAVFGGLVAVTNGGPIELPIALRWRVVVAIPAFELATREARTVLSQEIDRSTVVRNLSRLISLTEGLRRGDATILSQAGGDELHEGQRASLHPTANRLIETARDAGAAHAAWSGAGPTIIALCEAQQVEPVRAALAEAMPDCDARVLDIATRGLI